MSEIKIYNEINELVVILENALNIGYSKRLNELWDAQFSLPAKDTKNSECIPFRYVEIFDEGERVDLFRIIPTKLSKNDSGAIITYGCEHVLATLLDDVLFQYHQIGNLGVYTVEVLEYILSYQSREKWQLGTCDFTRQFEYKFENENLLKALFSVPKLFDVYYQWTWDTTTVPWTLNLIELTEGQTPSSYIRYKKNMKSIQKEEDATQLCTRIYPLGYGEGINQLTIKEVNEDIPYIDANTQNKYGVISKIWVDRRYEYPETLKAMAESMLEELKTPKITYSAEAAELYSLTERPADKFEIGTVVRVIDDELKEVLNAFIVAVKKNNIDSEPWNCSLEIANKLEDIGTSMANISDRQSINELYSQGATNIYAVTESENADSTHPVWVRFYIPEGTVRINQVLLNWSVEAFRAYSSATAGGGSTSSTTSSGGATSSTTEAGGYTATSSGGGGGTSTTTGGGGGTTVTSGPTNESSVDSSPSVMGSYYSLNGIYNNWPWNPEDGGNHDSTDKWMHNHEIPSGHYHNIAKYPHTHNLILVNHTHSILLADHTHSVVIPNHAHGFSIAAHSHGFTLPNHVHAITYGIYTGSSPSSLSVVIDGNNTGFTATSGNQNITDWLAKDGEGKITRGAWHYVAIYPNTLGRINANLQIQLFVQSRGGGNY